MNNQYLFNVKYYKGLYDSSQSISDANRKLVDFIYPTQITESVNLSTTEKNVSGFMLQTVYPGMLIGTGNPHAVGDTDEEIKLGFSLDYTTGLPYISGSTVKGTIHSIFKEPKKNADAIDIESYNNRSSYLLEVINKISESKLEDCSIISDLGKEIFGSDKSGKGGDVFFDAFPVRGDHQGKLFGFESITPHKATAEVHKKYDEKYDPKEIDKVANPTPLRLLKVLPDVVFCFNFIVKDSKIISGLTADKKIELFKKILTDFGIGAKTNVGFGMLKEFKGTIETTNVRKNNQHSSSTQSYRRNYNDKKESNASLKVGDIVEGEVSEIRGYGCMVNLGNNKNGLVHISQIANHYVKNVSDEVEIGQKVRVKILNIDGYKISLSMKDV